MKPVTEIKVGMEFGDGPIAVGRLALDGRRVYFEYDADFPARGLDISPYHLPLQAGLSAFDGALFDGLPGVFNDSIPDGWGRLLVDRLVESRGVGRAALTPLDRLAFVGRRGPGALFYEPRHDIGGESGDINLDLFADRAEHILEGAPEEVLAELHALGGSSGGARPKAHIGVAEDRGHVFYHGGREPPGHEAWLVKFPGKAAGDGRDAGAEEYVYALMAREAGIAMPDVHLFPSANGPGYFGVKLVDRDAGRRWHKHSACGLLHSDFRQPSLDYRDLARWTGRLTGDMGDVAAVFRLAVFNTLAHNRDDHSKNFSFLMDAAGKWRLAPAYDLTYSEGFNGWHCTTVMGKGANPGIAHLEELGKVARWDALAAEHGVERATIKRVRDALRKVERSPA